MMFNFYDKKDLPDKTAEHVMLLEIRDQVERLGYKIKGVTRKNDTMESEYYVLAYGKDKSTSGIVWISEEHMVVQKVYSGEQSCYLLADPDCFEQVIENFKD